MLDKIAIQERLDRLFSIRTRAEALEEDLAKEKDKAITDEVRRLRAMADELEMQTMDHEKVWTLTQEIGQLHDMAAKLEESIKAEDILFQASVKAFDLQVVYSPPRALWDDKALRGYAAGGHPEILEFRSMGKASASIRPVNGKGAGHDE